MIEMRPRSALEGYQNGMIEFSKRTPRNAKFAEMGSGKTASELTAFADLLEDLEVCRGLVVGPLRVVSKTWPDEINEWEHLRHLRYTFLDGSATAIARKIDKHIGDFDLWGISCDKIHVLAAMYFGRRHPWDTLIIDESSRFKNGSSKRTQSMKLLTIHPLRVSLMTGTPVPNGVKDLWAQIFMLDRGERLGRTMSDFKKKFFMTESGTESKSPNKTSMVRAQKKIADITYVLRPEDFQSSSKAHVNPIKLDLGKKLLADYKKFEKEYILKMPEGEIIKAVNTQGLGQKLLQFASGAIYDSERNVTKIHDIKIDALAEIVEDNPGKPVLVAYNFIHEIKRIQQRFPEAELFGKDPSQQDRWNAGEIPILIAHPKSAAHGLNLQYGGHILVWLSFDYNLELYLQMNKRLDRKGQVNDVIIHQLIMSGTIDEIAMKALNSKDNVQNKFQDDLKRHILELLQLLRRAA